jgi:hypothetical protein
MVESCAHILVTTAFLPSSTHTIKEKRDKDCAGWECCYENMSKGSNFQDSKIDCEQMNGHAVVRMRAVFDPFIVLGQSISTHS